MLLANLLYARFGEGVRDNLAPLRIGKREVGLPSDWRCRGVKLELIAIVA